MNNRKCLLCATAVAMALSCTFGTSQAASSTFSGDWKSGKKYTKGQIVEFENGTWIAVTPNSNQAPGTSSAWVSLTGPEGKIGPQGAIGPQGPAGPQGATGPQGPAGASGGVTVSVGQTYQGGKVFWVDNTGQHGLIVAMTDQGSGPWYINNTPMDTYSTGDGIYAGKSNTDISIAAQVAYNLSQGYVLGDFATKIARSYKIQANGVTACTGAPSETCFGDWYLPSEFESILLCSAIPTIQGGSLVAMSGIYWTSTEVSYGMAVAYNAASCAFGSYYVPFSVNVRAIRSF